MSHDATVPTRSGVTAARLVAVCALLVGLALVQDPGYLVPDTKFDLVLDPGGFLGRALHLWDARGAFGQLQNQAYGYLWPMGPFFWVGHLLDVPGWAVQRFWVALVMCVAFVGSARVARALGVRTDAACIVAGLAYALSPRLLTTLGPISIEAWPSALAPWVLLPLVLGSRAGSPRRAAALSALAVAMVGGVNAAATFAVLPLGVVWLLTRTRGPRRRALMLWWPVFTLLGTLWWLVPLFVMGAYSPPFLDFIESASVTTFPTTLFDSLRGTSDWVPYIDAGWRAGNDLVTRFYLPLDSGVVLALGFVGLLLRRNPHRAFLSLGVLVGLVMVTAGHLGDVQGWFAGGLHRALDGTLAPLRNVHKFDPVLRLPLVVGLGWAVEEAGRLAVASRPRTRVRAVDGVATLLLAAVVVGASALPALEGRLTPSGATVEVPGYWRQTAAWLDGRSGDGSSLLLPGSSFGNYLWGEPGDEPMQALARSAWAVRNAIPLAPPGDIRMLDAVETRMAQGQGSAGLAELARRAGVRYLVVRNDLARSDDVPDPVLVHQALAQTPGVTRVRSFGPVVGGSAHLQRGGTRVVVNEGWQSRYPAVEIFRVAGSVAGAVTSSRPPVVVGGPEDLLDLADLGVLRDQPTRLAVDGGRSADVLTPLVLTDGMRARERFFGRLHDGASATLTPGDRRRSGNPVRDFRLAPTDRWSTTTRLEGVAAVSASSSESDADTVGGAVTGQLPFAAIDGSRGSQWVSGGGKNRGAWWQVDLLGAREPGSVTLVGGAAAADAQTVRVRTESGVTPQVSLGPGERRVVPLPAGATSWVRVQDAADTPGAQLALAEVAVPGVDARRVLVLPRLPAGSRSPDVVVLRALRDARTGCVEVDGGVRCVPGRGRPSEEATGLRRSLVLPAAQTYLADLRVVPRVGGSMRELLQRGSLVHVAASSRGVGDLRGSELAAVDGDPHTTWTAAGDDLTPTLDLQWLGARRIRGVAVTVDQDSATRRPTRVELSWPGGRRTVSLDAGGRARFDPIRTDRLSVRAVAAARVAGLGFDRLLSPVGVGISELRLRGAPFLPAPPSHQVRRLPCGSGPTVSIAGRRLQTAVSASPADLTTMRAVPARICGADRVRLPAGESRVDVDASAAFAPASLVLERPGWSSSGAASPVTQDRRPSPVSRVLRPSSGTVLTLRQNVNAGWVASQRGRRLPALTLDGWQQGFALAGSDAPVVARFGPDAPYRWGLGLGLLCLLGLAALTLVPGRRWPGRDLPPLGVRPLRPGGLVVVGVLGGGMLAGWPGAGVAVLAVLPAVLPAAAPRRTGDWVPWVLGALCLLASIGYVLQPWGSSNGWAGDRSWPHYLVLVPVVAAVAGGAARSVWPPHRLSRIAGRSTRR